MKKILQDYLDICTYFNENIDLHKKRKTLIEKWRKTQYTDVITLDELVDFCENEILLRYEFCIKVVIPTVEKDFFAGNIDGLKLLFEIDNRNDISLDINGSFVSYFWNEMMKNKQDFIYNDPEMLADLILEKEPDNILVLTSKYKSIKRFIQFSIHEVPHGILCNESIGMNVLTAFSDISQRLGKDNEELIKHCKTLYTAWYDYLKYTNQYFDFEDYLIKNQTNKRWQLIQKPLPSKKVRAFVAPIRGGERRCSKFKFYKPDIVLSS